SAPSLTPATFIIPETNKTMPVAGTRYQDSGAVTSSPKSRLPPPADPANTSARVSGNLNLNPPATLRAGTSNSGWMSPKSGRDKDTSAEDETDQEGANGRRSSTTSTAGGGPLALSRGPSGRGLPILRKGRSSGNIGGRNCDGSADDDDFQQNFGTSLLFSSLNIEDSIIVEEVEEELLLQDEQTEEMLSAQTLWAQSLLRLKRSIDELYTLCEFESDVLTASQVQEMLGHAAKDFADLRQRLVLQEQALEIREQDDGVVQQQLPGEQSGHNAGIANTTAGAGEETSAAGVEQTAKPPAAASTTAPAEQATATATGRASVASAASAAGTNASSTSVQHQNVSSKLKLVEEGTTKINSSSGAIAWEWKPSTDSEALGKALNLFGKKGSPVKEGPVSTNTSLVFGDGTGIVNEQDGAVVPSGSQPLTPGLTRTPTLGGVEGSSVNLVAATKMKNPNNNIDNCNITKKEPSSTTTSAAQKIKPEHQHNSSRWGKRKAWADMRTDDDTT
ncbi:unnamed protein product, partial [Amoebophrya sp. A120]